MKRDILFRGEVKYNGNHLFSDDWVYGSLIIKSKEVFIYVIEEDNLANIVREFEVEVIPDTIGQFTGLLDKNGNKIFEGDILKSAFKYKDNEQEIVGIVEADKYNPCFAIHYKWQGNGHDCYEYDFVQVGLRKNEVIGNIIDNPELLNG